MATTKRKAEQEETEPERPKAIRSMAAARRKSKQEETESEESQEIVRKDLRPAVTITLQSWMTPIVGMIMLIIGLLGGYYARPATLGQLPASVALVTPAAKDQTAAQKSLMDSVVAKTRHFKGDANAPVTIIEFADFQCPYCGRFFSQTEPQIDKTYIQTGKVRFGYYDFAFLGQESNWAAEAAECAADQDKFWEYHDKLYSSQSGENQGAFNKDNLKKLAKDLGLDTRAFNECLDSGKYTQLIQDESSAASSIGVRSTPTFLVNGQPLVGAQPFDAFQQVIESFLK